MGTVLQVLPDSVQGMQSRKYRLQQRQLATASLLQKQLSSSTHPDVPYVRLSAGARPLPHPQTELERWHQQGLVLIASLAQHADQQLHEGNIRLHAGVAACGVHWGFGWMKACARLAAAARLANSRTRAMSDSMLWSPPARCIGAKTSSRAQEMHCSTGQQLGAWRLPGTRSDPK